MRIADHRIASPIGVCLRDDGATEPGRQRGRLVAVGDGERHVPVWRLAGLGGDEPADRVLEARRRRDLGLTCADLWIGADESVRGRLGSDGGVLLPPDRSQSHARRHRVRGEQPVHAGIDARPLNADYVRTARSKGAGEGRVIVRDAMRNALMPLTTAVAIDFGTLLSGAIITETIFAWKGMGSFFVEALTNREPKPLLAFVMVTAVAVVIFNLLADLIYAALDPRIRLE